jgi:hypothetical protein
MSLFTHKPAHAPVKAYYFALVQLHLHGHGIHVVIARHAR